MERNRMAKAAEGAIGMFHDEKPRGKGHEVRYSARNAFALSISIHLIDAGFPQLTSYQAIAALWPRLSLEFDRISSTVKSLGPTTFTDNTGGKLPKTASDRDPHTEVSDPTVFLLLLRLSKAKSGAFSLEDAEFVPGVKKLSSRLSKLMADGIYGVYLLELSGLIKRFNELVGAFPPRRRGPNN